MVEARQSLWPPHPHDMRAYQLHLRFAIHESAIPTALRPADGALVRVVDMEGGYPLVNDGVILDHHRNILTSDGHSSLRSKREPQMAGVLVQSISIRRVLICRALSPGALVSATTHLLTFPVFSPHTCTQVPRGIVGWAM